MPDPRQRLELLLSHLIDREGVLGACIVSRDGIRVMDAWRGESPLNETFAAMTATAMGAAEIALNELGAKEPFRFEAKGGGFQLCAVGAGEELLLLVVAAADADLEALLPPVHSIAKDVEQVVVGG